VNRLTLLVSDAHGVLYGQRDTEVRRSAWCSSPRSPSPLPSTRCAATSWWLHCSRSCRGPCSRSGCPSRRRRSTWPPPTAPAEQYIEQDFEEYYSNQPSQNFATQVFLNNIRVGFLAFAAGILLCVVTAAILAWNGANGGMAGGLFTHAGQADKFWGLILPHGMIELSAVVVAGAAGLRIGWAIIDPGDRPRFNALTEEARRAGSVLVGLVVAFLLAGLVEGFVTGKPWPTSVRVGIGVLVFALFWGWTIVYAVRLRRSGNETYTPDAALL
jgi:uncharacterized membrane protein SpoIIM required for sporulation